MDETVRLWDKVLLCCSESSLQSWWVDKEFQKALMKEEQLWKERVERESSDQKSTPHPGPLPDRGGEGIIIPLNLDGHLFSPEWKARADWKEQHLTSRLAADFTGWEQDNAKFESPFERVVRALRADGTARERTPKPML